MKMFAAVITMCTFLMDGFDFPGVGAQGDLLRVIKRERLLEMGGGRRPQEMFVSGSRSL